MTIPKLNRNKAYFAAWGHDTLAQFAADANAEIAQLQKDRRDAIDAYRALVTEIANKERAHDRNSRP
jgi:hypothetical protein